MGFIEILKGFFISMFLSSSWSYLGRQSVGILAILLSLTKGEKRNLIKERALARNAFNTNPYCTGVMIGIVLNNENELQKESFFSLQHIFGSIGDEFFWRALRPTLLSLSVLFLLIGYLWSKEINSIGVFVLTPLLFLLPYNIIAQGIRVRGLSQGKKLGRVAAVQLVELLRRPISKLYNLSAFIIGMILTILPLVFLSSFTRHIENLGKSIVSALSILAFIVLSFVALRSDRASSYLLIGGLLIFLVIKVL
jgi:mannose/fructose/N-acetylgalactosamine-specific phosphotransferase system component IID